MNLPTNLRERDRDAIRWAAQTTSYFLPQENVRQMTLNFPAQCRYLKDQLASSALSSATPHKTSRRIAIFIRQTDALEDSAVLVTIKSNLTLHLVPFLLPIEGSLRLSCDSRKRRTLAESKQEVYSRGQFKVFLQGKLSYLSDIYIYKNWNLGIIDGGYCFFCNKNNDETTWIVLEINIKVMSIMQHDQLWRRNAGTYV